MSTTVHPVTTLAADTAETRASFTLGERAGVWFVKSGELHLFAIRTADAGDAGARDADDRRALRPLFSVTAGQTIVSLPRTDHFGISLVVRRVQDGEITAAPLSPSAGPGAGRDGFAWLESWIVAMSRCAAGDLPPKSANWLEPGGRLAVEEKAVIASSSQPLIWIRQTAGASHFLGRPDLLIPEGALFPLSRAAWLEAQPNAALEVVDDVSRSAADVWRALELFHTHVLSRIASALDARDDATRQRLVERESTLKSAVAGALRALASPLQRGAARVEMPPEAWDTPLMRACQLIGSTIDVQMKPHPDLIRGLNVKTPVASIAQASGVRYRRVALKDEWWKGNEPLLAFRRNDEPLALIHRGSRRGYQIADPATGLTSRLDAAALADLNPFAYMFYRPFPQRRMTVSELLAFGLRDSRSELLLIVAMSLATGLLALTTPFITGVLFNSIIPSAQRPELLAVTALLLVSAIVAGLFNMARGFAVLRLQGKLSISLQAALWDRLLGLPLPFFRDFAAGDLAQRSLAFAQIRAILTGATLSALLSGVFSVTSFALLLYYSPILSLWAVLMTCVAVLATVAAGAFGLKFQRRNSEMSGAIYGAVIEFITAIAKFRIAGAERRAFILWVRDFAIQKRTDFDARQVATLMAVFNSVYVFACTGVLFAINSSVRENGAPTLSTGDFLAFLAAFAQFMAAALQMGGAAVGIAAIVPIYERASPILQALPEVTHTRTTTAPREVLGGVEASHLDFRYRPDTPLVMRDLSFQIKPGEFVAFVGPSGSGKSTLLRLLLGFEQPESGALYYDGMDAAGLDIEAIRRQIGVVLQSGTMLSGSLKDNICGTSWATMDEVWAAARVAALDDEIRAMPMGMHTMVTEGGGGLSGGQRQRVLIARAVIGRPRLLLFDEATSALDNRTQALVSENLRALKATRIVIAHRLSTIVDADRILVMDRGQIVQSGTYQELMAQPGLFRSMAERQVL
jgi:NHLM bacteriocin system ABC transporter ATP-binding protein